MTDQDFMRLAILEAEKSGEDVPVGAVITFENQVIASACNRKEAEQNPLAHAEMLAISRVVQILGQKDLKSCCMYVTLEPCPMCAGALVMSGIGRLVYGAYDRQYGCCGSVYALPMDAVFHHTLPCVGGVLEQECEALLNRFFKDLRQRESR